MTTHRVTISSITTRGVEPQFFAQFIREVDADEYDRDFRKLAARAGVLIRVDRDVVERRER
jgi:hypothetical protein